MKWLWRIINAAAVAFLLFLTACGGGGGGGTTVSGIAAAGSPLIGTAKLKDSSNPAKELSSTIAEDGSFSFDVSGLTPPFVLKATGSVGSTNYTLYSFANGAGTANITPLANLAVAMASGGLDPATIYASPSSGILQTVASKLAASVADIQTRLQTMLALYDSAKVNPITDTFTANHTGIDEVNDMVTVDITGGTVTITNKANNAAILTGSTSNSGAWTVDASKIPIPPVRAIISPIFTTAVVGKTAPFSATVLRSANQKVTWSVIESGGGTVSDTGVYTAPTTEGTYHVKAVAVADSTRPAIATVKVITGQPVNIAINPTSATVAPSGTKAFTATVTGTSNTQVTWSVVETNGGTITSSGAYTAPVTAGTFHVKATSTADSSKSAVATVTVSTNQSTSSPSGAFPIGIWDSGKWGAFTINKLVQTVGSQQYYSGSISYPTFNNGGIISVSGNIIADSTIIYDGQNLSVNAALNMNGTKVTSYAFLTDKDQLHSNDGGTYLWGNLIIVSNEIGYSYADKYVFYKK